jgi:hypothetical protein
MSTRCQIAVEHNPGVFIYMHNDGYPDGKHGVLAWLLPFVRDFHANRGHDPEYLTARIIARIAELVPGCLGLGVGSALHGDEAYIYVVRKTGIVEVRVPTQGFWDEPDMARTTVQERHNCGTYDASAGTFALDEAGA